MRYTSNSKILFCICKDLNEMKIFTYVKTMLMKSKNKVKFPFSLWDLILQFYQENDKSYFAINSSLDT